MKNIGEMLTFMVANQRFALRLHSIDRVIQAVAVTKLTNSPDFIEGVVDYFGEILTVLSMRKRLGLPPQDIRLSDRFIIAITPKRKIALIVDQVEDVIKPESIDLFKSEDWDVDVEQLAVFRTENGIVIIRDLEKLMTISEEIQLEQWMESNNSERHDV